MIAPVLWLCALLDRDLHSVPSLPSLRPSSLATEVPMQRGKVIP
jgi:hypothetical protein